ncbi:TetR/AcrR family transcriptional regulator [Microbacterium marinilacus]|uniref:TetR/AcrR family transcriptional regulator n=1 Tax=Microbacterium marinilacus TaxID=415209 RepID=A0ABP7B3Q2_9MICO|nr:TetR family transcriptional regulator [Microbacterium marinilacus]MBY0687872.1 TetR family transcriptional regulator [Microbacterium marinilacus]
MSRPPRARDKVLDAFETILIAEGDRAATIEAVAAAAGVSKGGLLYHFASKDDLERALVDRLDALAEEDVERGRSAPDGTISYYLRSSGESDTPFDRAIVAVARLAHGGHPAAADALRAVRERWEDLLRPHTRDAAALDLVMLVGDGLYLNAALDGGGVPGPLPTGDDLAALIRLVEDAAG